MIPKISIHVVRLIYYLVMLIVPFYHTPYTFFIDTIGSMVSLTSITFIYMFYFATVPEMLRTCIQGLSRLLLVCLSLVILRHYVLSLMVHVFHDFTQNFILEYPYLSCCLVNSRVTLAPFHLSHLMLILSRLGLMLFTMQFQSMNHEIVVWSCIALTVGIPLIDLILSSTLTNFSYCNINIMKRFIIKNNFKGNTDIPHQNQLLGVFIPVLAFTALFAEITFQLVTYYKEHKCNKVNNGAAIRCAPPLNRETQATGSVNTEDIVRSGPAINEEMLAISSSCVETEQNFRLALPSNPGTEATSRSRRLSYPMTNSVKANFHRFSIVGTSTCARGRKLETPFPSLQENCWLRTSPSNVPLPKPLIQSEGPKPSQTFRSVGNQVPPPKKKLANIVTFILLLIAFICYLIAFSYYRLSKNSQKENIWEYSFISMYITLFRVVQYCLPIHWISDSEEISAFALTKSKIFVVKLVSFSFWPISVQNLASLLQ